MTEEVEKPAEEVKPKKSKTLLIVIIAITANVAIISGVIVFFARGKTASAATHAKTEQKEEVKEEEEASEHGEEPGPLITLSDFILNIRSRDGQGKYLKASVVVQLANEHAKLAFKNQEMIARNEVLMYLSGLTDEQIQTVKQKQAMEKDLKERINSRLKKKLALGVFFTEFVTQ